MACEFVIKSKTPFETGKITRNFLLLWRQPQQNTAANCRDVLTGAQWKGIRNVFIIQGIITLRSRLAALQEERGMKVSNLMLERASCLNAFHPPHGYNIYVEM
jgi:hypothetical protein